MSIINTETTTARERKQDFIGRMDEMGLVVNKHYELLTLKDSEGEVHCRIKIIHAYNKDESSYFHLICHALMGLIAHFQNRKWIKDWGYVFIYKATHTVIFTNESD